MDLKSIAWVGDIYHKFEAMCLEMEESMYQDTVTYVENQVQTVGASVKKFYSDVMQDLVPPASIDPVKVAAADLSLNPYVHDELHKKAEADIKEDSIKVINKLTDDAKDGSDRDTNSRLSSDGFCDANQFSAPYSRSSVKSAFSEMYPNQAKDGRNLCRSRLGIKRKSTIDNYRTSTRSISVPLAPEDRTCDPSGPKLFGIHGVPFDQMVSISAPASHAVTACDSAFSNGGEVNIDNNNSKDEDFSRDACMESALTSQKDSDIGRNEEVIESSAELVHTERLDNSYTDVSINNDIIEPEMVNIEQSDELELEETCVLVDGDKICFVSNKEGKHKSYKKKIREAFKSARKQEYEQLASQFGEIDEGINQACADTGIPCLIITESDAKKSPAQESCDSEWELL